MPNPDRPGAGDAGLVISGIGVTSAIGQGKRAFVPALLTGRHRFAVMARPGRQRGADANGPGTAFLGAEIETLAMPDAIAPSLLRTASLSAQVALATVHEAWDDAALAGIDPERIGLVIGGSNLQQRELVQVHEAYRERPQFLRPTYAMSFLDSDLCGLCTEVFGIRGFAVTVGGASASGQVAVLQAIEAVRAGTVDACIAVGALMDISHWECQGFRSLGAMGSDRYADRPDLACRPFDRDRDGFIYGESCAALVIERDRSSTRVGVRPYARVGGWAMGMDGNRNPNPSLDGEVAAIGRALSRAGVAARDIDYVNPHGTGSAIGDVTELQALARSGIDHARINVTKSVIGHGLSAAGAIELAAVALQMRAGRLHPSRNLDHCIEPSLAWVGASSVEHRIENALNLSMGFGGVNTAVCLQHY